MAYTLSNTCTKNLCKLTLLVQLIVKNVVTCFFGTQCRLEDGGGGRGGCPTPCKKGGGIVRKGKCPGNMSGRIFLGEMSGPHRNNANE